MRDHTNVAIDAFLRGRRSDLVQLVSELVSTDSQMPPHADERGVVEVLKKRMAGLGLPLGDVIAADVNRPNLITRIPGSGRGQTLLLNGHVDTKPIGDAEALWNSDPLVPEVRNGRMYGLGTSDMKAAVAAMVFAAAALGETDTRLRGDLVLAFTADEEDGGGLGSRFIARKLRDVDACLIGEPSGCDHDWQGIHLVSRGICCFRVRVRGTQMHSSLSDRMPSINASLRMADLLLRIKDELDLRYDPHVLDHATPTVNAGVLVSGGVYYGVLPGVAEFGCDLRTVPGMTEREVRNSIDQWLRRCRERTPGIEVDVEFEPTLTWVPPSEISPTHDLVAAVQSAAVEVLGAAPPLTVFPGTTDAPWYDDAGISTIPSFGPGVLTCCHGPNEYVDIESIHQAARMYARIAVRYCGES
jgi:acetylornithine deacetylase/succinyl-diaminopimelate desuccinylase family protein